MRHRPARRSLCDRDFGLGNSCCYDEDGCDEAASASRHQPAHPRPRPPGPSLGHRRRGRAPDAADSRADGTADHRDGPWTVRRSLVSRPATDATQRHKRLGACVQGKDRDDRLAHRGAPVGRSATVFDGAKARATFSVVVGQPSTPTPLGTFFIVEKIHVGLRVTDGPWALATSAYSNVLEQFAGGPGQIALHGVVGLRAPLGTFASHGCVRFGNDAITWIATHVGNGTPVIITA